MPVPSAVTFARIRRRPGGSVLRLEGVARLDADKLEAHRWLLSLPLSSRRSAACRG